MTSIAVLERANVKTITPKQAKNDLFDRLMNKEAEMAVIGLGYVGLPLAVYMASTFRVKGYDINSEKVKTIQSNVDPCGELDAKVFENKDITYTDDYKELSSASFFIVAVPTPIDEHKQPNLNPLSSATTMVAKNLKKGDVVVFESTVYPGCTEEVCVPILEGISGLKYNEDFFIGYSPERINPGDEKHTFTQITKVVSGSNKETLDTVAKVYSEVVLAGVHKASSIKVAEASKIVENTQRDVNIALMNELSYIFSKAGIAISDVLEAAGTKWNFLNFFPGLVGGHCIGVDPYYLMHKANELGVTPNLITASRETNEHMYIHIGRQIERMTEKTNKNNKDISILVRGITFKENVQDLRNSKVIDLVDYLRLRGYPVTIEDPYADKNEAMDRYKIDLKEDALTDEYDVVVMGVNHDLYHEEGNLDKLIKEDGFMFDIRGTFGKYVRNRKYKTI